MKIQIPEQNSPGTLKVPDMKTDTLKKKKRIKSMYVCIYIYTHTLMKEINIIVLLYMEKQKQAGGRHRNCTPNTQVYLLNPKSHCLFGRGHPYLQELR